MANLIVKNGDFLIGGNRFFGYFFSNLMHNDDVNVDVMENNNSYEIEASFPGIAKDDLSVHYDHDVLTIKAYRESQKENKDEDGRYFRQEKSTAVYQRQFVLKNIEESKINTKFEEGVLKITLPKVKKDSEEHVSNGGS